MDEAELAQRRTQMGHGIACLADADMEAAVGEGRWRVLTGAPSPDMNMALLHRDQPGDLTQVLERLDDLGCPALIMFAGAGNMLAALLPAGWADVGTMPMMTVDLAHTPLCADPRVRRAGGSRRRPGPVAARGRRGRRLHGGDRPGR